MQNINIEGSLFYGAEILEDAENMSRKLGNRGWAFARLNEVVRAEADFIRSHEIVTTKLPKVNEDLGESHRALSYIARWRGDYQAAITHGIASVKANQAAFGDKKNYTQHAILELARTYSAAGLPKMAETTAREGLVKSLEFYGAEHGDTISFQAQIGAELSRQGRYREAKEIYEGAIGALGKMSGNRKTAMVDLMAQSANNLTAMGKSEAALSIAQNAATLGQGIGGEGSSYHTNALVALSHIYEDAGKYDKALSTAKTIIGFYQREGHEEFNQTLAQMQAQKAGLLHKLGQDEEALKLITALTEEQRNMHLDTARSYRANRILEAEITATLGGAVKGLAMAWPTAHAISQDATRLQAMSAGSVQDSILYRTAFSRLLNIAVLAGDDDKALWAAGQLLQTSTSRAALQAARREAADNEDMRIALKAHSDLAADLTVAQVSYAKMASRDPVRAKQLALKITKLEKEFADVSKVAGLNAQFDVGTKTANLKGIRKVLGKTEAVLFLVEGPEHLHNFTITKTGFHVARSPLSPRQVHDKIDRLRMSLSVRGLSQRGPAVDALRARSEFDVQIAHELYISIFPPEVEALLEDIEHIKVAANGGFSRLPLTVLVRTKPSTENELPDWLIKHWQYSVLASPQNMQAFKRRRVNRSGFLGVGAPKLTGITSGDDVQKNDDYFAQEGINGNAIKSLPSLPGTRREIEEIAKIFDKNETKILLGANMNEGNINALDLRKYGTLLFATHGLVSGELSGLSEAALVLTPPKQSSVLDDGLLRASEISRLDISADWVILSACNTAMGDSDVAPGFTGLARAFLYAGADSLLVSHWPVRDDAAAFLTVNTVKNTQAGKTKPAALQSAILDLMSGPEIPNASHPAVWAPFVLVEN